MKLRYTLFVLAMLLLAGIAFSPTSSAHASSYTMGCFIDTPAYDQYRMNDCYLLGSTPSTASFKVFGSYDSIIWSESGCTSSAFCNVPISPGQDITVTAYVIVNSQIVDVVSATAHYEFEPSW